jgi:hypothetical protein
VSVALRATNEALGLVQFEFADGATSPAEAGGQPCRSVVPTVHAGRYVYFRIDDSFKWADQMVVDIEVEYFDRGTGCFLIEYDGPDPNAPFNGAYTASKSCVTLGDSGQWKIAKFRLPQARLLNSQNGGADFRIVAQAQGLCLRRVKVMRPGMPVESGALLRGWQHDFAEPPGSNWLATGEGSAAFSQVDGLLRAGPQTAGPSTLWANPPANLGSAYEVLARVRPVEGPSHADALGGLTVGWHAQARPDIQAVLGRSPGGQSLLEWRETDQPLGKRGACRWTFNQWYWMRVRHSTNAITGYPDLWARLWLADGETPEPDAWTAWCDYFPGAPAASGQVGLVAAFGLLEWDYFLILAASLPEIRVCPPTLKPRRPHLQWIAAPPAVTPQLMLQGESQTPYALEYSADFRSWDETPVTTDDSGLARFIDSTARGEFHRFYRAHCLP